MAASYDRHFLLKNRLQSWTKTDLSDPSKTAVSEDADYQLAITLRLLSQTRLEAEASGAEFAIVLIPSREELRDGNLSRIESVAKYCEVQSIRYLNLAKVLQVTDYFQTDIHLTRDGHALVAEKLFDFLIEVLDGRTTTATADAATISES